MKLLKKFCTSTIIIAIIIFFIADVTISQTTPPKDAASFFDRIIEKQNERLAESGLQLVSYEKQFDIGSKANTPAMIDSLFSEKYFYFPVHNNDFSEIDVLTKEQLLNIAENMGKDKGVIGSMKKGLTDYLEKKKAARNTVYKLNWTIKGDTFSTLAIMDSGSLIYESIIVNLVKFSSSY